MHFHIELWHTARDRQPVQAWEEIADSRREAVKQVRGRLGERFWEWVRVEPVLPPDEGIHFRRSYVQPEGVKLVVPAPAPGIGLHPYTVALWVTWPSSAMFPAYLADLVEARNPFEAVWGLMCYCQRSRVGHACAVGLDTAIVYRASGVWVPLEVSSDEEMEGET